MINWDEVKVGETEIIDPCGQRYLVQCRDGQMLWLKTGVCYYSRALESMQDWSIYDPWEEITEECDWVRCDNTLAVFYIEHKKEVITHEHLNYKSDGRRVWKRKEG